MPAPKVSRRQFLMGCSAAVAAMAGARLTNVALAQGGANQDILVVVFLRGAWDVLNVLPPIGGMDRGYYEDARRNYLRIPASGTGAAINLGALDCVPFGLHPEMVELHSLYQQGRAAFVLACGMNHGTRSHFDAMQFMEMGTPGVKTTGSGWITRHLQSAANLPPAIQLPAVAANSAQPTSLLAYPDAVSMTTPSGFTFYGSSTTLAGTGQSYRYWQQQSLRQMYNGATWLDRAGIEVLDTLTVMQSAGSYTPRAGVTYPSGSLGTSLRTVAQLIKMNVGLQVATIDFGGWDTHEYQGASSGYMAGLLDQLSRGLTALYSDLDDSNYSSPIQRTTIVVMSEFGRRLRENNSQGCDHGHGSAMIVLGGRVNGGRLYGSWPGLRNDQLFDRADLAVTTDYRAVLSEILVRRLGNGRLDVIFPDITYYTPLGIVQGTDVPVTLTPAPPPPPFVSLGNDVFLPMVRKSNCLP
jgi:uncharacterized protein (DUF1501 family)